MNKSLPPASYWCHSITYQLMRLPVSRYQLLVVMLLGFCRFTQAQQVTITSVSPNPVCAGSTINVTYTYAFPEPGTAFLYLNGPNTTNVLIGTASVNGGNGSVPGTIPADRITGSYTVLVRRVSTIFGTVNSPTSPAFTVNAQPGAPGVFNVAYCFGTVGVPALTATGQNLKWYTASTGGPASTSAPTPPTSTTGTTNYYVSQTVNGCESSRAVIQSIITPLPNLPTVVSSLSYCQNATAPSLAGAVLSGTNLKWYSAASGGVGNTTAPVPPTSVVSPITYYVSQTNGDGCESGRAAITVTIKANPNPPSVGLTPVVYCQNVAASPLSATAVSGGTLLWYSPSGTPLGSTAPLPPTSSVGSIIYSVSQTVNGCESGRAGLTVTVNPLPPAPRLVTASGQSYPGGVSSLTVGQNTGTVYLVIDGCEGGTISYGGSASSLAVSTANTGVQTFTATCTQSGCTSPVARATVTVVGPDLVPLLYARPTTLYGQTAMSVVVDVLEINGAASSGLTTVRVSKESKVMLTFNSSLGSVGGRTVQNSLWTLIPDANYYILTTTQVIAGGNKLSFGLNGILNPGSTSGMITISTLITGESDTRATNNADADKVEYFQQ